MTEEVLNLMEKRKEAKMKRNEATYRTLRRDIKKLIKKANVQWEKVQCGMVESIKIIRYPQFP